MTMVLLFPGEVEPPNLLPVKITSTTPFCDFRVSGLRYPINRPGTRTAGLGGRGGGRSLISPSLNEARSNEVLVTSVIPLTSVDEAEVAEAQSNRPLMSP